MSARPWLGGLVLLSAAAALWAVFTPSAPEAAPVAFESSAQCRDCHAEVYREWEGSWHAKAWTDPDVRTLSNDFANTDCIDCHAPRPVFETGVGQRVLPRIVVGSASIASRNHDLALRSHLDRPAVDDFGCVRGCCLGEPKCTARTRTIEERHTVDACFRHGSILARRSAVSLTG